MKLQLKNLQKVKKIRLNDIRRFLQAVSGEIGCSGKSLEVVLCDNALIRGLNCRFLHKDRPTDVIAFPLEGGPDTSLWGAVVVSVEEAVAYSGAHGLKWEEELARYLIHGILHLEGYDDHTPAQKRKMSRKENEILKSCFY